MSLGSTSSRLESNRRWRANNPEKVREYGRRNYQRRKAVWNANRVYYLYGITREQYEDMLAAQKNRCAICDVLLGEDKSTKAHVDHYHVTDKVRAILCNKCNCGLGQFRDEPELLHKAAAYLESFK